MRRQLRPRIRAFALYKLRLETLIQEYDLVSEYNNPWDLDYSTNGALNSQEINYIERTLSDIDSGIAQEDRETYNLIRDL